MVFQIYMVVYFPCILFSVKDLKLELFTWLYLSCLYSELLVLDTYVRTQSFYAESPKYTRLCCSYAPKHFAFVTTVEKLHKEDGIDFIWPSNWKMLQFASTYW